MEVSCSSKETENDRGTSTDGRAFEDTREQDQEKHGTLRLEYDGIENEAS